MKKILITICGRSGSKGFKNKNLKIFLGKPLVYYTLVSAFDFKSRSKKTQVDICLNTDSFELKNLVREKYPEVFVIDRPKDLCDDFVPKIFVYKQSLNYMEKLKNYKYDYLIDLDITSPLRQKDDVINAYNYKLERADLDLVFSVCNSRRNPYFNMVEKQGKCAKKILVSDFVTRQQAPLIYDMNASIYVFSSDFLRNKNNMWDAKCDVYVMKDTAVLDIDSKEDFEFMKIIAECLYDKFENYSYIRDLIR